MTLPTYEVYAVKYGEHDRNAASNFLGGDPHDGPMPMDYFVWVLRRGTDVVVVDAGFNERSAQERGRRLVRSVPQALRLLDIDVATVPDVILTHMHYDHIGCIDAFPSARFHLQDLEMAYATGRHMAHHVFRDAFDLPDVLTLVEQTYKGRVRYYDGDADFAPGISPHLVGGHTRGLQIVRVRTERGWVVLASDATHFYRNMREERPFPIIFNIGDMLEGYRRLEDLADTPDHIVPGHDPLVLKRYPPPAESLRGTAASLHVWPQG